MYVIIISVNILFAANYRILSLLEREDWPALAYYLEQKMLIKGHYSSRKIRLLASSYLIISDYASVERLEAKLIQVKPAFIEKNALIFGVARILGGNYINAALFYKARLEYKGKIHDKEWLRWFYGFSHMLAGSFDYAEPEFSTLAASSSDFFIYGLSAYFLQTSIAKHSHKPDECRNTANIGKERVIKTIKSIETWKKETQKMGTEVHTTIIKKYIDEAGNWIFSA
jgi:hypothetical protein